MEKYIHWVVTRGKKLDLLGPDELYEDICK